MSRSRAFTGSDLAARCRCAPLAAQCRSRDRQGRVARDYSRRSSPAAPTPSACRPTLRSASARPRNGEGALRHRTKRSSSTAGTTEGVKVGQEYFVRRVVRRSVRWRRRRQGVRGQHSHGRLDPHRRRASDSAIANVVKACDGIEEGDYLEPFVKPAGASRRQPTAGEPDYATPATWCSGDERRQMVRPAT